MCRSGEEGDELIAHGPDLLSKEIIMGQALSVCPSACLPVCQPAFGHSIFVNCSLKSVSPPTPTFVQSETTILKINFDIFSTDNNSDKIESTRPLFVTKRRKAFEKKLLKKSTYFSN